MPYPFPGMNPWLERPGLWPDVHDNLVLGLQRTLAPLVRPRYYVAVKQRTVTEDYLEVVETATHRVITAIEILSPSNKQPGRDRRAYEYKRERIFRSPTHLVEIDLLRDGQPMPVTLLQTNGYSSQYRILVKRGEHMRRAYLYPFSVRDPIPVFPLSLQPGDTEPLIHLGVLLEEIYDELGYDLRVDYTRPPAPPLSEADARWAAEILQEAQGK